MDQKITELILHLILSVSSSLEETVEYFREPFISFLI